MQVWDTTKASVLRTLTVDCSGFMSLLAAHGVLWAGARNGSVYTFELAQHTFRRELRGHCDSVRTLCAMGHVHVVSGAGSNDGTVVVWRDQQPPQSP